MCDEVRRSLLFPLSREEILHEVERHRADGDLLAIFDRLPDCVDASAGDAAAKLKTLV